MMTADDCIFCKIIAGEIPSFRIHEDGETLAFMDINPAQRGHCLVIPKHHAANLYEMPDEALAAVSRSLRRVATAVKQVVKPDGINIVQANGRGANQSVFHFHFHIMPRTKGAGMSLDWESVPGDMDAIGALGKEIAAAVV